MKSMIKFALLPSVLLMSAGAFATSTLDQAQINLTGSVTNNASTFCNMSVPKSIDLGQVDLNDIILAPAGKDIHPVDFQVKIRNCVANKPVHIRFMAVSTTENSYIAQNAQGVDGAQYVGVAFREVIGGQSTPLDPMGTSTPDQTDSDGMATHDFTASIVRTTSANEPTSGPVYVSATLTLEAI